MDIIKQITEYPFEENESIIKCEVYNIKGSRIPLGYHVLHDDKSEFWYTTCGGYDDFIYHKSEEALLKYINGIFNDKNNSILIYT